MAFPVVNYYNPYYNYQIYQAPPVVNYYNPYYNYQMYQPPPMVNYYNPYYNNHIYQPPPVPVVNLYPMQNYTFRYQEFDPFEYPKDDRLFYHLRSLRNGYVPEGMRTTVQGALLTHRDYQPCIVLLKRGNFYKLPGGRLKEGEDEKDCLERKLSNYLGASILPRWRIGECVATWWRPNYDNYIVTYDTHVPTAKERIKIFLVSLIETATFEVPDYYYISAYLLGNIEANPQIFGPLSFLPQQLHERLNFNMIRNR